MRFKKIAIILVTLMISISIVSCKSSDEHTVLDDVFEAFTEGTSEIIVESITNQVEETFGVELTVSGNTTN